MSKINKEYYDNLMKTMPAKNLRELFNCLMGILYDGDIPCYEKDCICALVAEIHYRLSGDIVRKDLENFADHFAELSERKVKEIEVNKIIPNSNRDESVYD